MKESRKKRQPRGASRPGGKKPPARPGGKRRTPESGASLGAQRERRQPQLTGRAAILAVVVCAIVLSLAYPVREYIAQRRQIAELQAQKQRSLEHIHALEKRRRKLDDPTYIKRLARDRLGYCMPGETCYVVVGDGKNGNGSNARDSDGNNPLPWYVALWSSVETADDPGGAGER